MNCDVEASDSGNDILWYKTGVSESLSNGSDYTIVLSLATGPFTNEGTDWKSASTLTINTFSTAVVGEYSCMVDYTAPILDDTSSSSETFSILGMFLCTCGKYIALAIFTWCL